MKVLPILLACLIGCCLACEKAVSISRTTVTCAFIADAEVLPAGELPCNYNQVYRFKGEIYTRCVCCACFKVSIPMNCDGLPLCESQGECLAEFDEKAVFLFNVEEL